MPISLCDSAWHKLPDAYGRSDTGRRIAQLARKWDGDLADDLFWSCLCHQDTLSPATFAAMPHIVALGHEATGKPRCAIAAFLGYVALKVQEPQSDCCGEPGLAWVVDKLRWERLGLSEIVPEALSLLPQIAELEQSVFVDGRSSEANDHAAGHLAAKGFCELSRFLRCREHGAFVCKACGRWHDWILFGDRIAYYDDVSQNDFGGMVIADDVGLDDWKRGTPDHAAGFAQPRDWSDPALDCLRELLQKRANPTTATLARFWRAGVRCASCDWMGELT